MFAYWCRLYGLRVMYRVGQNPIYTLYKQKSWQKFHQISGHIQRIYMVLGQNFWPTLGMYKLKFGDDGGYTLKCTGAVNVAVTQSSHMA